MVELFKIGHVTVYLFGVMIAFGMIAGMFTAIYEAKRKGLDENKFFDLIIYTAISALLGSRLYYIIAFNLKYYLQNPLDIFAVTSGGLSIQGGLLGGITFALLYTGKKKIPFWQAADAAAPGIAIGQAIGRIGCDVFGVAMSRIYPWGINVGNQVLHPAQMYEMILDLILAGYLWNRRGKTKYNGEIFIKYIIGFSINRAIVEFFRSNPIVFGPFTIAHVTSLVFIIIALLTALVIKNRNSIETPEAVNIPLYQYLTLIIIGVVGAFIYYNVH